MGRAVMAVVAGYATMFAFVFVTFSLAYLLLGAERTFASGTYEVSGAWILVSFVLSFVAAIAGGRACRRLARAARPVTVLAALVLVLGLVLAMPTLNAPSDPATLQRSADVGTMAAMQKARTPAWVALLTPLVGAIGVLLAARRE